MSKKAKSIEPGTLVELILFGEKVTAVVTDTSGGNIRVRKIAGAEFEVKTTDIQIVE
jgi:hypothetical protein